MFAPFPTPAYAPFAIAFVVMIGIGLIEAIGPGMSGGSLNTMLAGSGDGDRVRPAGRPTGPDAGPVRDDRD